MENEEDELSEHSNQNQSPARNSSFDEDDEIDLSKEISVLMSKSDAQDSDHAISLESGHSSEHEHEKCNIVQIRSKLFKSII